MTTPVEQPDPAEIPALRQVRPVPPPPELRQRVLQAAHAAWAEAAPLAPPVAWWRAPGWRLLAAAASLTLLLGGSEALNRRLLAPWQALATVPAARASEPDAELGPDLARLQRLFMAAQRLAAPPERLAERCRGLRALLESPGGAAMAEPAGVPPRQGRCAPRAHTHYVVSHPSQSDKPEGVAA